MLVQQRDARDVRCRVTSELRDDREAGVGLQDKGVKVVMSGQRDKGVVVEP